MKTFPTSKASPAFLTLENGAEEVPRRLVDNGSFQLPAG